MNEHMQQGNNLRFVWRKVKNRQYRQPKFEKILQQLVNTEWIDVPLVVEPE